MIRRLIGAAGFSAALMVLVLWTAGTAVAVTLTLPLRDTGRQFPANSGVVVHRVSLAIPGLTEILRIDLLDLGTGTSSAPGVFSGFDLDAVFLDIDGDLATTSDRYLATGYIFSGGYVRPAPRGPLAHYYNPSPRRPGPLFGSNTKTSINHGLASLGRLDATNIADVNAALGFLSLGRAGRRHALADRGRGRRQRRVARRPHRGAGPTSSTASAARGRSRPRRAAAPRQCARASRRLRLAPAPALAFDVRSPLS
jgi:hypothetical protein